MGRKPRPRRAGLDRVDPNRPRDVLEAVVANIDERLFDLVPDLPICVLGETDRTWGGDPLEPRSNVDPVAHQIAVAFLDYVADMDSYAKLNAPVLLHAGVALDHAALHFDRAADCVDHAAELDEDAVARALDGPTVMRSDGGIDQIAAETAKARENPILVRSCKPGIADDVGHQDRG
jgi:hypothetical protein